MPPPSATTHPGPHPAPGSAASPVRPGARRAVRSGRPSWLDLRLVTGVVLVLAAVVGGAVALTASDRTVQVWAVRSALAPGAAVTDEQLQLRSVRFASDGLAGRYLSARDAVPGGAVLTRGVGAGELLPRDAVSVSPPAPTVELPLAVRTGDAPASLAAGQAVDVWAVPSDTAQRDPAARGVRVLAGVPVRSRSAGTGIGGSGSTAVTVAVPRDPATLAEVLGQLAGRRVVLTPVDTGVDPTADPAADPAVDPAVTPRPTAAPTPAPATGPATPPATPAATAPGVAEPSATGG